MFDLGKERRWSSFPLPWTGYWTKWHCMLLSQRWTSSTFPKFGSASPHIMDNRANALLRLLEYHSLSLPYSRHLRRRCSNKRSMVFEKCGLSQSRRSVLTEVVVNNLICSCLEIFSRNQSKCWIGFLRRASRFVIYFSYHSCVNENGNVGNYILFSRP